MAKEARDKLLARWRDDPGSTYRTWFLWEERLKNFRSIRRGLQVVVDDIARAALKLGPSVTVERVDGALHDVFLSRHEAREDAYRRLDRWVRGWNAAR